MTLYPAMLKLAGRRVVVVGAGPVAMRKVEAMVRAGARVRLVAPVIPAADGMVGVDCIAAEYDRRQLDGAALVFACTNDPELNRRIAQDARELRIFVNAADQPAECDFFAASTVADGDVVVAVSTGGNAPGLAKRIAKQLSSAMPPRVGEFADLLGKCRAVVRTTVSDTHRRGKILNELASDATYRLFIQRGPEAVRTRLSDMLKE